MSRRLTPQRDREIREMELPMGHAVIAIADLLDEIDALRAKLDRIHTLVGDLDPMPSPVREALYAALEAP